MKEKNNYSRFWSLMRKARYSGEEADDMKRTMVLAASGGRTDSLKELSAGEYERLCRDFEMRLPRSQRFGPDPLRKERSIALHQMQLLGVNTADWSAVDSFCTDKRIAGKRFRFLTEEELRALYVKMLAIKRKRESLPPVSPPVPRFPSGRNLRREGSKALIVDISTGLQSKD